MGLVLTCYLSTSGLQVYGFPQSYVLRSIQFNLYVFILFFLLYLSRNQTFFKVFSSYTKQSIVGNLKFKDFHVFLVLSCTADTKRVSGISLLLTLATLGVPFDKKHCEIMQILYRKAPGNQGIKTTNLLADCSLSVLSSHPVQVTTSVKNRFFTLKKSILNLFLFVCLF